MTNLKKHQMAAEDKISQYLHKAKSFCKNHQNEIIVGSYIVLVSGLGITAIKMKRYKNSLDVERKALENSKQIIDSLKCRINNLENLSEIKDSFFNKAISNDLRHGGSFGGQQMAYRKAYLNLCNKAVDL